MYSSVFSKYELRELGVKVDGDNAYSAANCVGSMEEELEVRTITKNCRGVVAKTITRGAGNGTITMSLHIPYTIYAKMFDMARSDLKTGVQGYGKNSIHKKFSMTAHVYDEDDNDMFLAYPVCVASTGPNTTIENGAEEVAEVEIEIAVMSDDNGYCKYECIPDDLGETDATIGTTWMTAFAPSLVDTVADV